MLTDSHCHLLKEYYANVDLIVEEAKLNGIDRYITSGYDFASNEETIKLTKKHKNIYGTIGLHPQVASIYSEDWLNHIKSNATKDNIVAIGEIGLDYHYEKGNKKEQIELFSKQLKFAEENNIPVVIHSRDATEETINVLKNYKVRGIIHSFSGSIEVANIYIKMGFILGINGTITFKNSNLKNVVKKIELKNIVLETDSPYLTPEPYRGKTNTPKHIKEIAEFISLIKNISFEQVSIETEKNIKRIFDI